MNALGIVAELAEGEYNVINNATGVFDEVKVSATQNTYSFNAILDSATGSVKINSSEALTVPAWTPYYEIEELAIEPVESEDPVYYYVGEAMSLETSDFEVTGYTAHGTDTPITISGFEYLTSYFSLGANTVYAKVSYTDADGETENELIPFTVTAYDYPTAVTATLKESITEVFPGQEYTAEMFDFAVEMKSGAKFENGTLPEGFEIAMHGTMTAGNAGRPEAVAFDWSCNGKEAQINSEIVTPVSDYPVTIVPTQNKVIWYQTPYAEDQFDFAITWKSGLEYTDESGLTAPKVTYTFEPATAGPNDTAQNVVISWVCESAEGEANITVTPGANV